MSRTRLKKNYFTLTEMMVSFALFAILLVSALTFFKSTENILSTSTQQAEAYENSRIFFEMITRDLHAMYYQTNAFAFWQKPSTPGIEYYRNQLLGFISMAENPDLAGDVGKAEVKYMLWYNSDSPNIASPDTAGWVVRSQTYNTSPNARFQNNPTADTDGTSAGFTADVAPYGTSDAYQKLIPYVTDLKFYCYSLDSDTTPITPSTDGPTPKQPFIVYITLSLMDMDNWNRWRSLGGLPGHLRDDAMPPGWQAEPTAAKNYRLLTEKTYSKTIFIGKRELNPN